MEKVDIVIIGAGVVGLAIASRISSSGKEIVLLERHDGFGRETSSRNSEVIHAGLYYPANSLKARFCVEGARMMYELCREHGITHAPVGKVVVANSDAEESKIEQLLTQGRENGAQGLRIIGRKEVNDLEPNIKAEAGLWSPNTGIVDSHQLMNCFEKMAKQAGVTVAYGCTVMGLQKTPVGYRTEVCDATGETTELESEVVINSAGLEADKIAAMAGIDIDAAGYRIHPCKGEYFHVSDRHRGMVKHLVYPVPTDISLGVHTVLKVDGSLKLGPNAFYVNSLDYDVDSGHRESFFESARTYLPFIEYNDLSPDMAGIRAKLQGEGDPFRDFVIREESDIGLPGLVNLVGLESPALTASMAIAGHVATLINIQAR